MGKLRAIIVLSVLLGFASTTAMARCQGMLVLMSLHDNYRATLNMTGPAQRSAASSVLVSVGNKSAERLVARIAESGVALDVDRLETVMKDAERIAALALVSDVDDPNFRHGRNIDWLANQVIRSKCRPGSPGFNYGADYVQTVSPTHRKAKEHTPSMMDKLGGIHPAVIAAVVAALIGGGVFQFRRSILYRRQQVARMPRNPVTMELNVTYTDAEGNMQQRKVDCQDISVGGAKLRWDDPAETGALITVSFPFDEKMATVVWANQFFAGIAFETQLSKSQLVSVLENHQAET